MSEPVLKKFGRYFLLDQIGEGGMAEIFRARLAAPGESGRFVVIKRIQGANSDNPEFAQMFRAEVQVTMRFTHPNIVQLYESGEESGLQYIAMEWVEGRNVRQLLSRSSQRQQRVPIEAACFIVEQVAAGLHYAHSFKDRITGEPLKLVHRDVSPQNILVSYDGNIKIIDFGIAKASTNGEATRAGVIKGKLSYLSPEQVLGDVLDGRSDLFALGIVLWELLTLKRLFVAEGDNEFQVLKMIESCTTYVKPPSTYNPEVPKELDDLVMQALRRDPDKRFQTGEEMSRALKRILAQLFPDFGSPDLSTFIKKQFQDQIVEDRKMLQQLNGKAEELIALGIKAPKTEPQAPTQPPPREPTRVTTFQGRYDKSQIKEAEDIAVAAPPDRQMKVSALRGAPPSPPRPAGSSSRSAPLGGGVRPSPVSERSSGGGLPVFRWIAILVLAAGGGYAFFPEIFKTARSPATTGAARDQAEAGSSSTADESSASRKIHFRVFPDSGPQKTRITLNSAEIKSPDRVASFSLGDPLEVSVEQAGFRTFRKEFVVQRGDLQPDGSYVMEINLEPKVYGEFSLSTIPEIAEVEFSSVGSGSSLSPVTFTTPIYQQKLPVGRYRVTIRNKTLNVGKILDLEIREGRHVIRNAVPLETLSGKR